MYDYKLVEEITLEEGFRVQSYKDTEGFWTIGVGHMLGTDDKYANITWTPIKVMTTLLQDINASIYYVRKQITTFDKLTEVRQRVLISMMFNLGPNKFAKFKKMIAAINSLDYYKAYEEMLDSKWARDDVPNRAKRMSDAWVRG